MDNSRKKMDDKDIFILREKFRRRAEVAGDVEKRRAIEKTMEDLYDWDDELHVKLLNAKASAKLSKKHLKS